MYFLPENLTQQVSLINYRQLALTSSLCKIHTPFSYYYCIKTTELTIQLHEALMFFYLEL
jgi:hypothetical protein